MSCLGGMVEGEKSGVGVVEEGKSGVGMVNEGKTKRRRRSGWRVAKKGKNAYPSLFLSM